MLQKRRKTTHGFTAIEMIIAVMVLSMCALIFAKCVYHSNELEQNDREYRIAMDQLQNVMERISVIPDEKLHELDFDKTEFENLLEKSLPDGKISFEIQPLESPYETSLLNTTVSWSEAAGKPLRTITLSRILAVPDEKPKSSSEEGGTEQ